tara:strand:+ start:307 stop:459 length:153 start_codon:yes stop_codon:yes gene_type:complete
MCGDIPSFLMTWDKDTILKVAIEIMGIKGIMKIGVIYMESLKRETLDNEA